MNVTAAPEHIIALRVHPGNARLEPDFMHMGQPAEFVIVDTRERTAVDGALMASSLGIGRVKRRGRWFIFGGCRYEKHDPHILGTVTMAYWPVNREAIRAMVQAWEREERAPRQKRR